MSYCEHYNEYHIKWNDSKCRYMNILARLGKDKIVLDVFFPLHRKKSLERLLFISGLKFIYGRYNILFTIQSLDNLDKFIRCMNIYMKEKITWDYDRQLYMEYFK